MVLAGIYTGIRPIELAAIKTENVHLDEGYIMGGTKTKAGKDRIVLIHPQIEPLIKKDMQKRMNFYFQITTCSQAKYCEVNEYILKIIIGHEINDVTEASNY